MHSADYLNGIRAGIDPRDRGLAYGDGLFETMVAEDGRVRWLEFHLERLLLGCERLEIPTPDLDMLRSALEAELPARGLATVKLILTRGAGRRGYAPPDDPSPMYCVLVEPRSSLPALPDADVVTLELRLGENDKLAGIKHLSRLEQVMAQVELRHRGAMEGLLRAKSGMVVGGTSSNVFAVTGNQITTPRIETAGIFGVMRRVVLENARELGIETAEVDMRLEDLYSSDELFLTNAVMGIRSIGSLDGRAYSSRSMAMRLRRVLGLG